MEIRPDRLLLIMSLLADHPSALAEESRPGLRFPPSRHLQDAFCCREIVDETDETGGVVFRTVPSSMIASIAAKDATKIALGTVKLLAGPCSKYCSDDDATFDMNRVREMCGPTAYDCDIDEWGTGSCWMSVDAEEEYDEDEAVKGSESSWDSNSGSGSNGDEDDMAAGKVEWNEEKQEYDVEVEAGYDGGDAVVYNKATGNVEAASQEEQQGEEEVTVVEEVTTEEEEAEEPVNCISCHYFDRVRWRAAGKPPHPESFYDKLTHNPDNPDECMATGHWFGVVRGKTCDEVFASDEKYKICGQYPPGGRCDPIAEWSTTPNRGKIYGKCVYLCGKDRHPEDSNQR